MISTSPDIIILFTRYPAPGRCKTRLIPALGEDGATRLHQRMTRLVLAQLAELAALHPHHLEIHHDGGDQTQMRSWLGLNHHYRQQTDGDIGCRMQAAIKPHLGRTQRLLLIGSDCPDLSAAVMHEAMTALTTNDLVLGPAYDGGYYLIGMGVKISTIHCDNLFQNIAWGTNTVYTNTINKAAQQQLRCHTLVKLHDIDTPADLRYFGHHSDPQ